MASILKRASFSPVVTGAALLVLLKGPENIQRPVYDYLHQLLKPHNIERLITTLKWLFAYGLIKNVNEAINQLARNNFSLRSSKADWDWNNEIAIVTGGSSGFGALFSKDLSQKGIHVVAIDVNPLPSHLENDPKISFFKCDVTDVEAVNTVAAEIKSKIGHPSILINNAGIGGQRPILQTKPEQLKKLMGVNLFAHYYLVQAFLPNMLENRKGHIISIASMASFFTTPGITDYSCSKAAVLAFNEGLSTELRTIHRCPEIKTTVVHPFFADTPIIAAGKAELQKAGAKILDPQDISDAVVDQILNARSGQILLSNGFGPAMRAFRGLPWWLQEGFKRLTESDLSHYLKK
ncbi:NAD(P)-binding protein [Aureobasidium pullulans]|uniref:Short-chain dehydrogenase/reductase 3 n=1 Tax=Aureobasidium pullulans TaxID=5580 RepID=A0A4S9A404_AURPU|nr:NAD(P)-binding protein [Aureobasidium pullulans]